jgi:mono/diheme cytochrome c family protein
MIALSRLSFRVLGLSLGGAVVWPGIALAEVDYSAGKTPEQLFVANCAACHQSPQGLGPARDARSLTGFLREHYTTKHQSAALLADYLIRARTMAPFVVNQGGAPDATKGNERATTSAETLVSKVRSYVTAGQEAKPLAAAPDQATAPVLRPSVDAVPSQSR